MVVAPRPAFERLDPTLIEALKMRVVGTLIQPGDEEYDRARQTHDPAVDRYPAVIVRAGDAADVIRAVTFAREQGLPLAVRSGGHSLAGHGSVDGGVVLDLSHMKAVSVDPVRQTAWVQAGATAGDVLTHTQPHGLALATGDTSSVGIGGLTMGGGMGWLVRKYGLTIDNLTAVEMVTADGRLIVASPNEHPDLFWAVRGGGGNFGVATAFEFRLAPVSTIVGGALILPPTPAVVRGYADYALTAPDELTTIAAVMPLPPHPAIPAEVHGMLTFTILICYVGDLEEGQRVLDPLRALATPLADLTGPMPYPALYQFTAQAAERHTASVRAGFLDELSDEVIGAILEHSQSRPAPMGMVQIRALGGAMARVPKDTTAFAHRDKSFLVAIINMGDGSEVATWTEALWQRLRPYTAGVAVNFVGDEGDERVREAYPTPTYERLAEVKRRYDPTNLFRLNQNIQPAG